MPLFASLIEQPRTTLLDILKQNLEITRRETHIDRKVLIGEHDLGMSPKWGVGESIRNVAEEINEEYTDEKLTGVLLCYPIYFCVVIDGSENTLSKFITMLIKKYGSQIRKFKMLAHFHNIYARFVDDWIVASGKPPKLWKKMPTDADIERTFKYVTFCVKKLFGLCTQIKQQTPQVQGAVSTLEIGKSSMSFEYSTTTLESSISLLNTGPVSSFGAQDKGNKWRDFLPEYGLLQFLLDSPYVTNVFDLLNKMKTVPVLDITEDFCWPHGESINIDDFFNKPSDPASDLPLR
ncbi:uncharacterized protein LOC108741753 [Agrilus planipennis]|uniref:Uncharacterized protein LOC108741753 n=1 Tax=Agrilus planipennis TaxID=224129 RepID=A0A1W4X7T6_AGRPL|nr:uncharacterized protein LOC108741753 [Agrilus planipennis]